MERSLESSGNSLSASRNASAKLKASRMKLLMNAKYEQKPPVNPSEVHGTLQKLEHEMQLCNLNESQKESCRQNFLKAVVDAQQEMSKRMSVDDFEPLAVIGRGAFGEVQLVRKKDKNSREVYGKLYFTMH